MAEGRFVPNNEKRNIVRRILAGLDAVGIDQALFMPDPTSVGWGATDGAPLGFETTLLDMPVYGTEADSARAAEIMVESGAGCLVTPRGPAPLPDARSARCRAAA